MPPSFRRGKRLQGRKDSVSRRKKWAEIANIISKYVIFVSLTACLLNIIHWFFYSKWTFDTFVSHFEWLWTYLLWNSSFLCSFSCTFMPQSWVDEEFKCRPSYYFLRTVKYNVLLQKWYKKNSVNILYPELWSRWRKNIRT